MTPTVGRIVHYTLSASDAGAINTRRHCVPRQDEPRMNTGLVDRTGNPAAEGDVCAAVIVRAFVPATTVNLQVLLDGDDSYWATSRAEGPGPGFWSWPPRV
jgi:hypothetical protein